MLSASRRPVFCKAPVVSCSVLPTSAAGLVMLAAWSASLPGSNQSAVGKGAAQENVTVPLLLIVSPA